MAGMIGKFTPHRIAFVVCLSTLLLLAPRALWAHALLVSSTPVANSTVPAGDLAVTLQYNSRVDPVRSSLSLLEPSGKVAMLPVGHQPAPEILSTKLTGLTEGTYALRWQALSSDGHITRGEIPFKVR